MLTTIILTMKKNPERRYNHDMLPMLQGVLMERITSETAMQLHEQELHPYSQHIRFGDQEIRWHISALTNEFGKELTDSLTGIKEIIIRNREETLQIAQVESIQIEYSQLMQKYYFQDMPKYIKIRFVTPTAFKQNGQYSIFPTPRLIFQSLMRKYDTGSNIGSMFDEQALEHYDQYCYIGQYHLKSVKFRIQKTQVHSFIGELTLNINGPKQMVSLAWMLLRFGEFSGVGIKTGMGMGAIEII